MARRWIIDIPVRPKAVQSVRTGRGHCFPSRKVTEWKNRVRGYILAQCPGEPTTLPTKITRLVYTFKCPKGVRKKVREYLEAGGVIPYTSAPDLTDNINKGLVDVCAGIVFDDDKKICIVEHLSKVYGLEDSIHAEFEEIPDMILINGKRSDGSPGI